MKNNALVQSILNKDLIGLTDALQNLELERD